MKIRAQRVFGHWLAPYIVVAVVALGSAVALVPRMAGLPGFAD